MAVVAVRLVEVRRTAARVVLLVLGVQEEAVVVVAGLMALLAALTQAVRAVMTLPA